MLSTASPRDPNGSQRVPGRQAETSSQQLALLQRRQERMQRLEHDFAEERRAREAMRSGMELEMMQQRWDWENKVKSPWKCLVFLWGGGGRNPIGKSMDMI